MYRHALAHQLLDRGHQLVDGLILSASYVIGNTGPDVAGQQLLAETVERRAGRRHLTRISGQ